MPPPVRIAPLALAILTILILFLGAPRSEARIIRSDQTAILGTLVTNTEASSRDFILMANENAEPGWVVVYLQSGVIDITDEITSPGGHLVSVPPGAGGLPVQAVFLPAGAPENSIKTTTITAAPVDGNSPSQDAALTVRMLTTVVVNDLRDLEDPDLLDDLIDADPAQPGEQTTLRAAIDFCNARGGSDTIHFDLPGPGTPRLLPQSPLPEITGPIVIDGTSQPAADLVGVEISGEALPATTFSAGLAISAGNSTIRGLALTRFRSAAFGEIPSPAGPNPSGLLLKGLGGNTVETCLLGIDPSGQLGSGNEGYGLRIESAANVIADCLVSGNWVGGIGIFGPDATDNIITSSVGGALGGSHSSNFLAPAVMVEGISFSPHNATADFGTLDANLANSSVHFVQLNKRAPWESVGAGFLGGIVLHNALRNTVTGSSVQGNGADGIRIIGDGTGVFLEANVIGQPIGANPTLQNSGHGIALEGDDVHLLGNDTSGNGLSGVLVRGSENLIEGLVSSRNGECGIRCEGHRTIIGGTTFQARGQIYSNPTGILLIEPTGPVNFTPGSNRIFGNLIGARSPFGAGDLIPGPNLRGIHIAGSEQNLIGGVTLSGLSNTIAYNHREGILITSGEGNELIGNALLENGALGIDLSNTNEGDGMDAPDPGDLDEGGNHKANAPVLNQVVQGASSIQVFGSLLTAAPGSYRIEYVFFDPQRSLATAQFAVLLPFDAPATVNSIIVDLPTTTDLRGNYVRLSAIDPNGNSSEHSRWIRIEGSNHSDSDGISNEIESLVPSRIGEGTGDGDGDGQPDASQEHVSSLPLLSGGFLTLAASPGDNLRSANSTTTVTSQANSGLSFPHGAWSFATTPALRDTSTITVFVSGDVIATHYYNFGPTPDDPVPHWYDFSFDGTTGAQVLADRVVLHFVDGERGDHDLRVNGAIDTEGGMAHLLPALPDPRFTRLTDGSVAVFWDNSFPDLLLQESTSPGSAPWQFTNRQPFATGSSLTVRILPIQKSNFFRLARP